MNETSRVDMIVDLLFQEAHERKGTLDIVGKICEIEVDVMLKVMDTLGMVREAERWRKKTARSRS